MRLNRNKSICGPQTKTISWKVLKGELQIQVIILCWFITTSDTFSAALSLNENLTLSHQITPQEWTNFLCKSLSGFLTYKTLKTLKLQTKELKLSNETQDNTNKTNPTLLSFLQLHPQSLCEMSQALCSLSFHVSPKFLQNFQQVRMSFLIRDQNKTWAMFGRVCQGR